MLADTIFAEICQSWYRMVANLTCKLSLNQGGKGVSVGDFGYGV